MGPILGSTFKRHLIGHRVVLVTGLLMATLAGPGHAQSVDCQAAVTQLQLTSCAERAWQGGDADLNAAYATARDRARAMDVDLSVGDASAADLLRDAQRAWIPYRDAACAAESLAARGGSMMPMLVWMCRERLTRHRTQDLRQFGQIN